MTQRKNDLGRDALITALEKIEKLKLLLAEALLFIDPKRVASGATERDFSKRARQLLNE